MAVATGWEQELREIRAADSCNWNRLTRAIGCSDRCGETLQSAHRSNTANEKLNDLVVFYLIWTKATAFATGHRQCECKRKTPKRKWHTLSKRDSDHQLRLDQMTLGRRNGDQNNVSGNRRWKQNKNWCGIACRVYHVTEAQQLKEHQITIIIKT